MSIYQTALAEAWAITTPALKTLLEISARENIISGADLERLETLEKQKSLHYGDDAYRLRVIDDVAILDIEGPLFKKANMFQAMSGATSYALLAKDLHVAVSDPSISGIILNLDTPGGTVAGCDELAQMIYEARDTKPIVSFVSGMACSAGYWLGSAATEVVVTDASEVGSIGVVMGIEDRSEQQTARGIKSYEFVSSNAPNKRPNYDSKDGKAVIQKRVDDIEQVFHEAVSKHRNVSVEDIIKNFGAGGVELGAKAVELGMADAVGSFDFVLSRLTKRGSRRASNRSTRGKTMDNKEGAVNGQKTAEITQADVDKAAKDAKAQAKADTKDRMKQILQSAEGKANPTLANALFDDDEISTAKAVGMLEAAAKDKSESATSTTDVAADFVDRKEAAAGVGLPDPVGGQKEADDGGWRDAVKATNEARK